jgi:excisionase family DNA binding protein
LEEYLTVVEAAARLKMAPFTVRQWIKAGKLKGTKLGQQWRVLGSSVEARLAGTDSTTEREDK